MKICEERWFPSLGTSIMSKIIRTGSVLKIATCFLQASVALGPVLVGRAVGKCQRAPFLQ